MNQNISRRSALGRITGGAAALAAAASLSHRLRAENASAAKLKGRINHSVCKWCYGKIPLDEFCQAGVEAEKLHACLTRHEREREDDADGEVGEEEE